MPPSQAGIVPAALPAFSEPIGVRLLPSAAALSADTLACATPAASSAVAIVVASADFRIIFIRLPLPGGLERVLSGERDEVAVRDLVEVAATVERGVAQVEHELVEVVRFDAHGTGLAAFEEVAARAGGRAVDVMVEGDARRQREGRAEHAVVVGARGHAVAP